jgi:energy-coupling factor transport system substrate-specific component
MAVVVVAILPAIFGPLAGFIAGFAGHALADFASGYGIWWTWVIADGIFGLLIGLFRKFYKIETGRFGIKAALVFNGVQIFVNFAAWLCIAPVLDIVFYGEPANKVFLQGFVAALLNSVVVLVLGTILISTYTRVISVSDEARMLEP